MEEGAAQGFVYYSYREAEEKTAKLASAMAQLGLKRFSRVGIYGPNCCEWMLAM